MKTVKIHIPLGIYLLKVNNRNTRTSSRFSIVNFEHVIVDWDGLKLTCGMLDASKSRRFFLSLLEICNTVYYYYSLVSISSCDFCYSLFGRWIISSKFCQLLFQKLLTNWWKQSPGSSNLPKSFGSLIFSGSLEKDQWHDMR